MVALGTSLREPGRRPSGGDLNPRPRRRKRRRTWRAAGIPEVMSARLAGHKTKKAMPLAPLPTRKHKTEKYTCPRSLNIPKEMPARSALRRRFRKTLLNHRPVQIFEKGVDVLALALCAVVEDEG